MQKAIEKLDRKNDQQDDRMTVIEAKNVEQDNRLTNIEAKDREQDGRLSSIETKNTQQDNRMNSIESKNTQQDAAITAAQNAANAAQRAADAAQATADAGYLEMSFGTNAFYCIFDNGQRRLIIQGLFMGTASGGYTFNFPVSYKTAYVPIAIDRSGVNPPQVAGAKIIDLSSCEIYCDASEVSILVVGY